MSKTVFVNLVLFFGMVSSAFAVEVDINGKPYRGEVKNRAIQGATLQFDAQGNLTIDAPTHKRHKRPLLPNRSPQGPACF